ncbi:hypothetical protein WR25_16645 [Diploscapter pachys]|uniref:Uncharacterized protein n=1 Tax=Diploscapter pachys TaxID=2018661 RepID=A0A2A2L6P4_9BILA|nr:hypothetical protein WR25_16645 [Diploscapter pachys]
MCLQCYSARGDTRQVLHIASRMNLSSVLSMVDMSKYLSEDLLCSVICECATGDTDLRLLSVLLQKTSPNQLTSSLFMRIAKQVDQHFFSTILLSQCLGYSHIPEVFDDRFIRHLDRLAFELSFGIPHLFTPISFDNDFSNNADPYRMLSLWCVFVHHLSPVDCLCSFSSNPLVSYLITSRVAQSLAHQSHDWFFYEESLSELSKSLRRSAISLLDSVYKTHPTKAYRLLCEPCNGTTITDLAFQLNSRSFIAHECCQKWLHRLLHGHLRTTNLLSFVPRWVKIIISAIFVLPIFWLFHFNSPPSFSTPSNDSVSPAELLLDNENPHKRRRTISASFSLVSARSEMGLSVPSSIPLQPLPTHSHLPLQQTDSNTPQSVLLPLSVEDIPASSYKNKARKIMQPGCGNRTISVILWVWTFSWWCESFYVLYLRSQSMPLSLMPWRTFDCMVVLCFLLLQLSLSFEGPLTDLLGIRTVHPSRILSSLFLLYWCYSTLIYYTPISAVAMYTLIYPDRPASWSSLRSSLPSISYSLYSTDLSYLTSDTCRNVSLSFRKNPTFCSSHLNRHSNPLCPAFSTSAYFLLFEYFIVIKLILWPILFAFFAKTAKTVDEEADKIWKFQMYALVTEFRLRPAFPPPFTLLALLCSCCCSSKKLFQDNSFTHPDAPIKKSSKKQSTQDLWRQKAIQKWKEDDESEGRKCRQSSETQTSCTALQKAYEQSGKLEVKKNELVDYINSNVKRIVLTDEQRPWEVIMPRYNPIFYCKPENEFAVEFGANVDVANEDNLCELRKNWRNRQLTEMWSNKAWRLSAMGYPLNPNGRRGVGGRGNHRHFGANRTSVYVIAKGKSKQECMILTTNDKQLPTDTIGGRMSRDERLSKILQEIGLNEGDAQMLALRRTDPATPSRFEAGSANVRTIAMEQEDDTDHAWSEYVVWQVHVRNPSAQLATREFSWLSRGQLSQIPWTHKEIAAQSIDAIYANV